MDHNNIFLECSANIRHCQSNKSEGKGWIANEMSIDKACVCYYSTIINISARKSMPTCQKMSRKHILLI